MRVVCVDELPDLVPVPENPFRDEFLVVFRNGNRDVVVSLGCDDLLHVGFCYVRLRHEATESVERCRLTGRRPGGFRRCLRRRFFVELCDVPVVEVDHFWERFAGLGVPCGVVRRVDDALAALRLRRVRLRCDHEGLVVAEEYEVRPFLEERCDLLAELELQAVVRAHLVRLFELAHPGVRRDDHVDSRGDYLVAGGEEL